MPIGLNYETPRPDRSALSDVLPRWVVWSSAIVMLGLIARILVPYTVSHGPEAKLAAAKADVEMLDVAVEGFKADLGRYPTKSEGLDVLVEMPADGRGKWRGPYIKHLPKCDPWAQPYVYTPPRTADGSDFQITSYGPDQKPGGGDDITNQ